MTTKLYDLCVATREYTDKNGDKKAVWENIGAVMENDDGKKYMMLKAHFNPAAITRKEGSESILVSMFAPKNKQSDNSAGSGSQNFSPEAYDPNIPF